MRAACDIPKLISRYNSLPNIISVICIDPMHFPQQMTEEDS